MPDGTTFEFVREPADPERDPSEVVFTAQPGGPAPPPHVHPRQREIFTLEEGDFELLIDGEWKALQPGDSVTVERRCDAHLSERGHAHRARSHRARAGPHVRPVPARPPRHDHRARLDEDHARRGGAHGGRSGAGTPTRSSRDRCRSRSRSRCSAASGRCSACGRRGASCPSRQAGAGGRSAPAGRGPRSR